MNAINQANDPWLHKYSVEKRKFYLFKEESTRSYARSCCLFERAQRFRHFAFGTILLTIKHEL